MSMWQADTPSRMNRQGAARTYHTYLSWGYFQRRMAQQRETASAALSSSSSSTADAGLHTPQACCQNKPTKACKVGCEHAVLLSRFHHARRHQGLHRACSFQ